MGARVEWINGDVFDGASDVLVIPCSTVATVTSFTAERLKRFDIPEPPGTMELGDVLISDLPTPAGNIAMRVAYAASVQEMSSSLAAIERIGAQLGEAAANNDQIRLIATPLLGTGAGRLDHRDAAVHLTRGFLGAAPDLAVLRVFVYDASWYGDLHTLATERAEAPEPTVDMVDRPAIRVFVSYAHASDSHRAWVRELATFLRQNGLDARLDQWLLRPGMDMPQWMSNELEMAQRVVMVVDPLYSAKADRRHGGVGWETKLVVGEMYATQTENPDKFIPVFVGGVSPNDAPYYLRPALGILFPEDGDDVGPAREELLKALFRVYDEAPPIGQPPSFVLARAGGG